ncbi:hypothetical protein HMPREF1052_0630 [Pasteurella bettyae CCUG 2042]|uniref:Uncharacterized protein n=1 Tax=Pasteurella bettyae CCUG 2042 TaxID=1095749 RepID=I3D7M9_9PAST|nr:hypothetical protein HMPREF1052_0630 [Pasteurella bettyae CCUG 2042]
MIDITYPVKDLLLYKNTALLLKCGKFFQKFLDQKFIT